MNTFQRNLRALAHPASVAAIGLLLLNDHVLKAAWPSWVTGKLSDFTGVFFFPFLLGAVAAGALELLRWSSDILGARPGWWDKAIAYALRVTEQGLPLAVTAVWFAGMKTIPAANEWTRTLAGWAAGGPVVIMRDPTDVLALVMLWPAWWVWGKGTSVRCQVSSVKWRSGPAAYALLGLAALATMATAPCAPPLKVVRVTEQDGVLYAGLDWETGWAEYAVSDDSGDSWESAEAVPEDVAARLRAAAEAVVCAPSDAQVCYRLGDERVEESRDGGQTWAAAWEIPPGRRTYMERYVSQPLSCRGEAGMDFGPYDLAVFDGPAGTTVLVAMGTQGAMVGGPDGRWERLEVLAASPVPYEGAAIFIIIWEIVLSLGAAMLTLFGLTAMAWGRLLRRAPEARRTVSIGKWLAAGGVGVFGLALFTVGGLGEIGLAGMGLGALLAALGILVGWVGAAAEAPEPDRAWGMAGVTLLAALVAGGAPIALMYAWMAGSIAAYGVALGVALALAAGAVVGGARAIGRLAQSPDGGTPEVIH